MGLVLMAVPDVVMTVGCEHTVKKLTTALTPLTTMPPSEENVTVRVV